MNNYESVCMDLYCSLNWLEEGGNQDTIFSWFLTYDHFYVLDLTNSQHLYSWVCAAPIVATEFK